MLALHSFFGSQKSNCFVLVLQFSFYLPTSKSFAASPSGTASHYSGVSNVEIAWCHICGEMIIKLRHGAVLHVTIYLITPWHQNAVFPPLCDEMTTQRPINIHYFLEKGPNSACSFGGCDDMKTKRGRKNLSIFT
jgi:hypothetical protein